MSSTATPGPDSKIRLQGVMDFDGEKPLEWNSIYVYEAPVRLWHWVNALCVLTLCVTGYLIGSPQDSLGGEAFDHYRMGYVRFIHFTAGQILAVFFLMRIYWALVGNKHARQIFYIPFWDRKWWDGVFHEAKWYGFLREEPRKYVGHNPLAHISMFVMFTCFSVMMIITGFALYAQGAGNDSWYFRWFGWVFTYFPNSQEVHTFHHLGMWVIVCFILLHVYAAIREDVMSRQTMISTMFSGTRQFRDNRPD